MLLQGMTYAYEKAPSLSPPPTCTKEWGGYRTYLRKKGIEIVATLDMDTTWNLGGGRESTRGGDVEYLLVVSMKASSEALFDYKGGTFFIEYDSHHGQSPTLESIGALVDVDYIEAVSFDDLYALWYKQVFGNNNAWILVGKSDAYENFTQTEHSELFLNNGYSTFPTIAFFPSYPNPAMSVIGFLPFTKNISLKVGVFDGSLADGAQTGTMGVFGHFFSNLPDHAFIIGELDFEWDWASTYKGRLGIGWWQHTARFFTFGGATKRGTSGPYVTVDQILYKTPKSEAGFFFVYSTGNQSVNDFRRYVGAGIVGKGILSFRPQDSIGVGMSRGYLSQDEAAGFTEPYEASYEVFYQWKCLPWGYLEPDFQYIVNPGGDGLSNASVFTLRLQVSF